MTHKEQKNQAIVELLIDCLKKVLEQHTEIQEKVKQLKAAKLNNISTI
jgi:hypothetical protein